MRNWNPLLVYMYACEIIQNELFSTNVPIHFPFCCHIKIGMTLVSGLVYENRLTNCYKMIQPSHYKLKFHILYYTVWIFQNNCFWKLPVIIIIIIMFYFRRKRSLKELIKGWESNLHSNPTHWKWYKLKNMSSLYQHLRFLVSLWSQNWDDIIL